MIQNKFKDSPNTAVFTTCFVVKDNKEIKYISHAEEDGAWSFFSDDNFEDFEKVAMLVSLEEIIKMDNSVQEIADLPLGFSASRNAIGDPWVITKM